MIAPIPILARIAPREQGNNVFSNWIKACLSTYLEVFIRLGILFFIIVMIAALQRNIGGIFATFETESGSYGIAFLAWAFLIIGLVFFIKDFPNILKEVTGLDSGKYGKAVIRGLGMMTSSIGGGATATIRSIANDKDKPLVSRIRRGLTAGLSANARGVWEGGKVSKISDIPKAAGRTASQVLASRGQREAAGGWTNYLEQQRDYNIDRVKYWAGGSFEAQQQMLDEVEAFLKDAKAVKSTTEGFVRDKKYLFSMVGKGEAPTTYNTSTGPVTIDETTSLSATEAIIEALKSSGNAEDAKVADKINNDMQQRIKKIGQNIVAVSVKQMSGADFDTKFMIDKHIEDEAAPTLANAESQYTIVQQKMAKNSSLDAVVTFKKQYSDLKPDNV